MGTVVCDTGASVTSSSLTTPDCLTIADAQRQMVDAGAEYMVIEASSHALSQDRLAGIDFKAAAFTNLTGDHLDYHKTKENYLAAKTRLFTALAPEATAVLNKQVPESQSIAQATKARVCWYAVDEPADLSARIESMTVEGTRFILEYRGRKERVKTPLLGRYNVANHLAAAGLCLGAGLDLGTVAAGLSSLKGVPGRLEKVAGNGDFAVLVDYAHTDDALQNVLTTLKPLCRGRLIVLFGCGGDRDKTKRPRMAARRGAIGRRGLRHQRQPENREARGHHRRHHGRVPGPELGETDGRAGPEEGHRAGHRDRPSGRYRPARRQGARDLPDHRRQEIRLQRQRHRPPMPERATVRPIPIEARRSTGRHCRPHAGTSR